MDLIARLLENDQNGLKNSDYDDLSHDDLVEICNTR